MRISVISSLKSALQATKEQGWRAVLSALGVMVGVMAILLLIGISRGVQADVSGEVRDIGVNILIILPGKVGEGFNPNLAGQSFLKLEDARQLAQIPGVVRTSTFSFAGGGAKAGKKEAYPLNIAVTNGWFQIHKAELAEGRVLTPEDQLTSNIVLGAVTKEALFGKVNPLGKKVTINEHEYTVVGVTKAKEEGSSLFAMFSFANVIYLPYETVKQQTPELQIDRIFVQSRPEVDPVTLKSRVNMILASRLDSTQYSVLTEEEIVGMVFKLMNILTWLVTGLTSIAIVVGGIGIMTTMLMSVGQRAKEIGIRKTTGARSVDVFWQFIWEALIVSLTGGLFGLLVSWVVCLGLRAWTPIKPLLGWDVLAIGFGVSCLVGCVFGLIPALHAARKDPVVAMRSE